MGGAFPYGFANKHKQVIYIYSHTANAQDLVAIPGDLGNTDSEHPKHKSPSGVKGALVVLLWMNAGRTVLHSESNACFLSVNYD